MEQAARHYAYENITSLNGLQSAIILALLYFDIFNYPLTIDEIIENCGIEVFPSSEVKEEIEELLNSNIISKTKCFFHLNDRQSIVSRRLELNKRADSLFPKAKRFSDFISRFPFVEGVLITGSLAKGCMDIDGDIDYFVITTPGRLWFCRGLLTAFKKTFLLNSRKYFCINYYITADTLNIPDENIFTATEITFAKPTYNLSIIKKFLSANKWIYDYYPNKYNPDLSLLNEEKSFTSKTLFEKVFQGWMGEKIEEFFYRLFVWRWKSKFKQLDAKTFDINFRSRKNVSKHHPHGFQIKVLSEYEQKVKQFESDFNLVLL